MNREELKSRISEIEDKLIEVRQTTPNRMYLLCESENGPAVCKFLYKELGCRFVIASGVDADNWYEILYHFSYDQLGIVITVKAFIRDRENPAVESITPFVPSAEWIEREIHDLLGIEIRNHPDMRRLILADDWPEGVYPLRKEVKR